MFKFLRLLVLIGGVLINLPGHATSQISLLDVVEALQAKGHRFLYSSDLVSDQVSVQVDEISIRALQIALPQVALKMKRVGLLWVVTTADTAKHKVSGYLLSLDGDPIKEAIIQVAGGNQVVHSRHDGYFEIVPGSENEKLEFRAPGFQKQVLSIQMAQESPVILLPNSWIESMIVTGSRYRLPLQKDFTSTLYLSADEMQLVPALGGDSLRVVTTLPGVSSVGVSAKPRIRGGLQDELLVLLDGVELIEPFHLSDFQSVFSTIDDRTIDSVDFYTGGFPARYGNRMSGVMDISTAMPISEPQTEVGLSLFSSFINTRGYDDKGIPKDWILSLRRGNLADLSNITSSDWGEPKYLDAFARMGLTLSDKSNLYFGAVAVVDDVRLNNDEEKAASKIDTVHLWSRFDHQINDSLYTAFVFSLLENEREQTQRIIPEANDINEPDPEVPGFLDYQQSIQRVALRNDYSLVFDSNQFEFGLQIEYVRGDYDYQSKIDRGFLGELLGGEQQVTGNSDLDVEGWSGGIYASAQVSVNSKLTLQPGIRWDFQDYSNVEFTEHASPRVGLLYDLSQNINLRASIGRFYQPQAMNELQVVDGINHFFEPQKSDQAIVSLEWESERLQFRAEAYYKRYRDQKPRFENLFNTFVLLPQMEPDRIMLKPEKGLVKGFEIESRMDLTDQLSGQIRYGYMNAKDRINGRWVPRRWSQRHTAHAGLFWRQDDFNFSVGMSWHTGWRSSVLPASLALDDTLALEKIINNKELKNYFSVDISASKTWLIGKTSITLHADVINLLGRNNIAGLEYDIDERGERVFLNPNKKKVLPLAPSIGVIISF